MSEKRDDQLLLGNGALKVSDLLVGGIARWGAVFLSRPPPLA